MKRDDIIRKRYNDIAGKYDVSRFENKGGKIIDIKQKQILFRILKELKLNPNESTVIEIGCGTGRFILYMRALGFFNCYGLDQSIKMVNVLSINGENNLVCADGYSLPFRNNSFDFVYSLHVLMHIGDPRKFLREIIRISSKHIVIDYNNLWSIRLIGFIFDKLFSRKTSPQRFIYNQIKKMISDIENLEIVERYPVFYLPLRITFPDFYYKNYDKIESFFPILSNRIAAQYFVLFRKNSSLRAQYTGRKLNV